MQNLSTITPVIITYNESPNIGRTLDQLTWAKEIIIIDSYSTDDTLEIIARFPNAKVIQNTFVSHTAQWNVGLSHVTSEWVLSLDADYFLTPNCLKEITELDFSLPLSGYFIPFKYCVFGKPIRGSIYPPKCALFKKEHSYFYEDGHTQVIKVQGESGQLKNHIFHDDRKSLDRWIDFQKNKLKMEISKLTTEPDSALSLPDRIRKKKVIAPFLVFFYCLIVKGGILDGWRGWFYASQRLYAELVLSLYLIDARENISNK